LLIWRTALRVMNGEMLVTASPSATHHSIGRHLIRDSRDQTSVTVYSSVNY
jgi:hypothetical protein